MFDLFPRLAERRRQAAGTMSGGEQQMVTIARALMLGPRLLLLDEPSLRLAPLVAVEVFAWLREVNAESISILLVEQNVRMAMELSTRTYVLELGRIVAAGPSGEVARDPTSRSSSSDCPAGRIDAIPATGNDGPVKGEESAARRRG